MKKITVTVFLVLILLISFDVIADLYGPSAGYNNAPGGYGNCTSCHSSYSLQTSGGVYNSMSITQTGPPYGSPYTFNLNINCPGHTRVGFQLCILPVGATSTTASIGTISVPSASSGLIQIYSTSSPSRQYLEHTNTGTVASGGTKSWTFNWAPPSSGYTGNVNFYVCVNATNSDNTMYGDSIFAKVITFNVLPVNWLSVDATVKNNLVNINWSTASEINNSHYEIEKSIDNSSWIMAGFKKGNGNTNTISNYEFADNLTANDKQQTTNTLFYRIKQVDYDGKSGYSKVVPVALSPKNKFTVYPTLAVDLLHLVSDEQSGSLQSVSIYNLKGEIVLQQNFYNFSNEVDLDISSLRNGIYFIKVNDGVENTISRFVKSD
ncbi:MAG: T9SS type A sorting domain-containing protein [Bacteroidia bacterium]